MLVVFDRRENSCQFCHHHDAMARKRSGLAVTFASLSLLRSGLRDCAALRSVWRHPQYSKERSVVTKSQESMPVSILFVCPYCGHPLALDTDRRKFLPGGLIPATDAGSSPCRHLVRAHLCIDGAESPEDQPSLNCQPLASLIGGPEWEELSDLAFLPELDELVYGHSTLIGSRMRTEFLSLESIEAKKISFILGGGALYAPDPAVFVLAFVNELRRGRHAVTERELPA